MNYFRYRKYELYHWLMIMQMWVTMSNTQVDYKLLFVAEGNDILTIREECEECYKRACSEYFWHNESFHLGEAQQEGTGKTSVGN